MKRGIMFMLAFAFAILSIGIGCSALSQPDTLLNIIGVAELIFVGVYSVLIIKEFVKKLVK